MQRKANADYIRERIYCTGKACSRIIGLRAKENVAGRLMFSPWRRTLGILSKREFDRFCTVQGKIQQIYLGPPLCGTRAGLIKALSGSRLSFLKVDARDEEDARWVAEEEEAEGHAAGNQGYLMWLRLG